MMKTLCLSLLSFFVISEGDAQTIRRVNNNPGVTGVNVYSSAQAAHDAAAANDIMIIEPSENSYQSMLVTKPLKIYGNGYFLDVNAELRADDRSSRVTAIYLNPGAGGTEMYGIDGSGVYIHGASNITIERCHLTDIQIYNSNEAGTTDVNVSEIVIHRNFITSSITAVGTAGYLIDNVSVMNNIISTNFSGSFFADDNGVQNWIVRNNYLGYPSGSVRLRNAVFENNICDDVGTFTFNNVSCSYNVSSGNHFPAGIGNQNNFDFSNEFIGTGSEDEKLMIKSGSTLRVAASDGGEIGAFGGTNPYIISGIPAIPSVTEMFNTGTGSNNAPLQVTISVQSNN